MKSDSKYPAKVKEEMIRLHLEEGRTIKSLTEEYNLGKGTVTYWLKQYREECENNKSTKEQSDSYAENLRLRKENADLKKEIEFLIPQGHLEKAAAFFAKEMK